jgi:endonuclease-3
MKDNKGKESPAVVKDRARKIISRLKKIYPEAKTALHHENPLQLLVATILSAQCTDERVNIVTKELFQHYHTAKDYAKANPKVLEQQIRSTGFYRAKTRNIISCCAMLVEKYNGKVPDTIEQLTQLPGVGRKTANVVLGAVWNKAEGVVVDTHVRRLSQRLGFTKEQNPEKIERDLVKIIPQHSWILFSNLLIWHGRKICKARKPKCLECPVNNLCPSANSFVPH